MGQNHILVYNSITLQLISNSELYCPCTPVFFLQDEFSLNKICSYSNLWKPFIESSPFTFLSIYFYWCYCYLSCIIFVIKIGYWPTCLLWTLWYSLSQLVRWMGVKAEELGVEIYPGFAASEVLLLIFSWVSQLAVDSFLFARMFGILY